MEDISIFLNYTQKAMIIAVLVSLPPVLGALVVGFFLALFQALTQIQDQTTQMVAKIVIVFGTIILFGYWMGSTVYAFSLEIFNNFSKWVH